MRHRRRHRFSRSTPERVDRVIRERHDNWHAPRAVLIVWVLIAASIFAPYLLEGTLGWWPTYLAVSVPTLGCWQRALGTLTHESTHFALARNRILNFIFGTIFSGYAICQSWFAYLKSHLAHHLHLGDDERDPELRFQEAEGTYREKSPWRFAFKYLVAPLLLLRTPRKIWDLLRYRLFARPGTVWEWVEQIGSLGFIGAAVVILIAVGRGKELLLFWIVPLVTSFPIVNWYNELFEHFPYVKESDTDLYMTRNRWTDRVTRFFTGLFNEHMHQTHHLFPHCPYWVLPAVHEILMEDPEYRATQNRDVGLLWPIISGVPSIVTNILRRVAQRSRPGAA